MDFVVDVTGVDLGETKVSARQSRCSTKTNRPRGQHATNEREKRRATRWPNECDVLRTFWAALM